MNKHFGTFLTSLGVERPILITVFNLLIIIAGIGAIMGIDVRELPDVDRPIVSIRAQYDGASPKTMDTEVTSLIEGAVARIAGVVSIESSSEENNMRIRVEFQPGVDLNLAASDVREAVSRVQRQLPEDIDQVLIFKADEDANAIVRLTAYSDTLTKDELAKRVEKEVSPELLSIDGVADVQLNGDQPRTLRVMLRPAEMAGNRVSASEVIDTLQNARFDVPAGSYSSTDQQLIIRAFATVVEPERVERLHIRDNVRIGDVADVYYAPMKAESYTLYNGRPVIGLSIVRQAGSNTITIAEEVNKRVERINERSRDYELSVTSDDSVFIKGALKEVLLSLGFAIIIVLFITGIFLGDWKAVLVPAVTMPVSLIGTLAAIWIFGFSINLLTLLALVLATGLVVDDAIVVFENIQRRRAGGLGKMAAAVLGTQQVFFAVIATTATLVAVFVPLALLPGQTGMLFREFGLVLAISVMISSFVAVTLCPMLASRLPEPGKRNIISNIIYGWIEWVGDGIQRFYFWTLRGVLFLRYPFVLAMIGVAALGYLGFKTLDQELVPSEDRGSVDVFLTGPDGASLAYSDRQSEKVEAIFQPYQEKGYIQDLYTIVSRWDMNRAYISASLSPWEERDFTQMELAEVIGKQLQEIPGSQIRISQRSSLDFGGGGGGLEIALLGNEYEEIFEAANMLSQELSDRIPNVTDVRIQYDTSQPELSFNIDRERARDLDVPMDRISQTMRVMVDEYDVLDLSIEDQAVPILVGSAMGAINDPGDLLNVFVTNTRNENIPLTALVNVVERGVASELDRHAQRRAIELDIGLQPGSSLAEIMAQVEAIGQETLPPSVSLLPLGEAATLDETSNEVAITFLIAIVVVFLVLAAQFESIGSAVIVIFTVPFGLAAAVFTLQLTGQTLNLYSQIGLVLLVGLMTKNAILLVEFMDQLRDEGKSVQDAVMGACQVRLRSLAMTAISTIVGSVPLILSVGPGGEARSAIGLVIFGGLSLSTLFTLYLAPVGYRIIAPFFKVRSHASEKLQEELNNAQPTSQKLVAGEA
ncbi:MAG: efflux RND transporter permease subunit [Sumerlaeia bacterium]